MKILSTIRGRIVVLLASFFFFITISMGVMFWSATTQKKDALIINLAGRQRMLTQKMTWLALAQPEDPKLSESIELFDQTLQALRFGGATLDSAGKTVTLPSAPDSALSAQLDEVAQTWKQFRGHLLPADLSNLLLISPLILEQMDAVVTAFETRAEAKHIRLEFIHTSFLIVAMVLLAWGFISTRRMIVNPLNELGLAVQQMGEGNLDWPIPPMEENELGELAQTFKIMRVELAQSRKMLEDQVSQRTRELTAAFEFSQEIVAQRELNELMNSAVVRARLLMRAQSAALCVLSPDGKTLELVANSSETNVNIGLIQTIDHGIALPVVGSGQTILTKTSCSDCGFLHSQAPGRCVATPLRIGDHTLGAICVVRSDIKDVDEIASFDADGQRALILLANAAAIAITNARLAKAERQKAEQAAALAEREQLAADLHDNLAQTLSFTRLKLEQLDEVLTSPPSTEERITLTQIETAIATAYQQVRDALVGLLEPPAANDDFARKLSASVENFRTAYQFSTTLEITDPTALLLPPITQNQVIHIVQEALANVQRHSKADQAWVRVERVNGHARFTIEDNGSGFDHHVSSGGNHFGLRIMQTRAERSGGKFSISSNLGEGTQIFASFPLLKSPDSANQPTGVTS
jgi:two-component system, NarL family, nitrate/nitrite sensor histidine kinase NarX